LCLQLLPLALKRLQTFVQRLPTVAIFCQRHRSRLIGIAHALNLASKMLDALVQLGLPGVQFLR
jgi:hypothetical protein